MLKNCISFVCIFFISWSFQAQTSSFYKKSDSLHTKRRNGVIITKAALSVGTLVALDRLWYADHPRSSFHFTNDNNQWKQLDKMGHVMTSYYVGKIGMEALDWSGVSKKINLFMEPLLDLPF